MGFTTLAHAIEQSTYKTSVEKAIQTPAGPSTEATTFEATPGSIANRIVTQAGDTEAAVLGGAEDVVSACSASYLLGMEANFVAISAKNIVTSLRGLSTRRILEEFGQTPPQYDQATSYEAADVGNVKNLYSLKLGEYYMPMSQSFSLRAKKILNVSSLVDGIDIIQQTRKQAKVIDCHLRITLRPNQPNLSILTDPSSFTAPRIDAPSKARYYKGGVTTQPQGIPDIATTDDLVASLSMLAEMLDKIYEEDAVVEIKNNLINKVFGVTHAVISDYKFTPKVGFGTFDFNFALTEVILFPDAITFDATKLTDATTPPDA